MEPLLETDARLRSQPRPRAAQADGISSEVIPYIMDPTVTGGVCAAIGLATLSALRLDHHAQISCFASVVSTCGTELAGQALYGVSSIHCFALDLVRLYPVNLESEISFTFIPNEKPDLTDVFRPEQRCTRNWPSAEGRFQ